MNEAFTGAWHFLFHTWIGVRLVWFLAAYCALVVAAKNSYIAAVTIGRGMQIGGAVTAFACLYGMFAFPDHLTWLFYAILALLCGAFGQGIFEQYGVMRPQRAAPVAENMPLATIDVYDTGRLATPDEIERVRKK